MKKILLLFQMLIVAFAEPERTLLERESHARLVRPPVDTQDYLQELLDSKLEGEALLKAYDVHYDSMSPSDKLLEKNQYPDNVYADLLAHRISLLKFK